MSNALNNKIKKEEITIRPFQPHEIDDIQAKLDKQLGPEYVSTRPGAGGVRVSYIEGWKALNLANQVFGFDGWYSEVKTIQVDYLDERNGKFSVGLSIVVRVTLKDGTFHEDIGYGSLDNARTKAMAFEKAKKEAMTDGLKRALRCFGNAMGNCLYDKEYLSKISTVKCAPPDFDESNLIRFADNNAPANRSATIPPNALLNGHQSMGVNTSASISNDKFIAPDRTVQRNAPLSRTNNAPQQQQQQQQAQAQFKAQQQQSIPHVQTKTGPQATPSRNINASNNKRVLERDLDEFDDSMTFSDDINLESEDFNDELNDMINTKLKTPAPGDEAYVQQSQQQNPNEEGSLTANDTLSRAFEDENEIRPSQVSFVKARVAEDLQKNGNVSASHAFNPAFISPSIRRTVDPTKSTPIKRTSTSELKTVRYDNPRLMPNRQIGKPKYPPPKRARVGSGKENNVITNTNEKSNSQESTTTTTSTAGAENTA